MAYEDVKSKLLKIIPQKAQIYCRGEQKTKFLSTIFKNVVELEESGIPPLHSLEACKDKVCEFHLTHKGVCALRHCYEIRHLLHSFIHPTLLLCKHIKNFYM